jgi:hypothetical protein
MGRSNGYERGQKNRIANRQSPIADSQFEVKNPEGPADRGWNLKMLRVLGF